VAGASESPGGGPFFVGTDIGGTFTDTVVIDATGTIRRYKSPTTVANLVDGVLGTFTLAAEGAGLSQAEFVSRIQTFSHGTTVATNALLERRGAKTAVLLTEGFGDTLRIMRGYKGFGLDESVLKNWRQLVRRHSVIDLGMVREIRERIDYQGRVLCPLDEEAARRTVRELLAKGTEAIAVSLLWCTSNPVHELRLAEIIAEEAPGLYVSISSEVLPRLGEYSRTVTTAVNAFLGPEVRDVTASLESMLKKRGLTHVPLLMQSNGGLASVAHAAQRPVSFLLSGPVGGVVGSRLVADLIGEENVVTTDMGGTSFDVGLVVQGRPLLQPVTNIDGQPIGVPSVAVQTVGAGGGSIARVVDGALLVGPESAGATPGPACYGRGGTRPTVTDADVVLGLINPNTFLGGRAKLDLDLAYEAVREHVAEPLGMTVEHAAEGIKRIVDSKMRDLIRQATIHQGHDPRNFALIAFGGAGPVHAAGFAAGLGVKRIVIPITASVHSALGIAASDLVITSELSRMFLTPPGSSGASAHVAVADVNEVVGTLRSEAVQQLEEQGLEPEAISTAHFVDMRFRFQIHELTVELPEFPLADKMLDEVVARFIEVYEQRFGEGSAFTEAGVEMVTWRVVATGKVDRPAFGAAVGGEAREAAPVRTDQMYDGAWIEALVYDEAALVDGVVIEGPAIIELSDTNIVVGQRFTAAVDAHTNVILSPRSSDDARESA
jgi:N-methylhydantoinase A